MFKKDKTAFDNYTLSLGGMTTISSFAVAPAIAHERLRRARNGEACNAAGGKWRLSVPRRFRTA